MNKMKWKNIFLVNVSALVVIWAGGITCNKERGGKYSKEANEAKIKSFQTENFLDHDVKTLQRPFRIAKLNLVWSKAQMRLTEPKLKSLYMELKIHDKEEITWKELSARYKDKDGLKEDELRSKLIGVMKTYDLFEHFADTEDADKLISYRRYHDPGDKNMSKKGLFKDKKLNKLWEKAEISGFTSEELSTLKQEFKHHQDKVDMYYSLLENVGSVNSNRHENAIDKEELDISNIVSNDPNDNEISTPEMELKKYESDINALRDHHRGIKDHYGRLELLVSSGPHSQDFIEPRVQGLWKLAQVNNFTEKELSSIKMELHHFESRLLKLRHLHAEHALYQEKYKNAKQDEKNNRFEEVEDLIKKQTRKVHKLKETIEKTIFKHNEL